MVFVKKKKKSTKFRCLFRCLFHFGIVKNKTKVDMSIRDILNICVRFQNMWARGHEKQSRNAIKQAERIHRKIHSLTKF